MATPAAPPVDNSDLQDAIVGTAPAAPQGDNSDLQDAVVGTAPAAPQPTPYNPTAHVIPPADDPMFIKRDTERVKGFVKGLARTGAGLLDVANTPMAPTTNGQPYAVPGIRHLTDAVRARTQTNNPEQESGDFVEHMLEFVPFGGEEAAAGAGMKLADKFGIAQDLAKFASKYPKIASAVNVLMTGAKTAARGGGEQGVQTYLKTGGDVPATEEATKTGAIWTGALGTAAKAAGEIAGGVRNFIEGGRPGSRTVAGASFETRPTPTNPKPGETPELLLRNAKDVAQDPATQAVDEALGNVAKTGVASSLNRANAARAPEGKIIPPSRRLAGRGGFTVGPAAEPTPVVEGQTAFEPGKQQTGTKVGEGKGPGKFDYPGYAPELFDADAEQAAQEGTLGASRPLAPQQGSHREPTWQYRNAVKPGSPEPGVDTATGPGTLILHDDVLSKENGTSTMKAMSPERARTQLAQYDRILSDPDEVEQMPVHQHQDILNAREDIAGQLSRYDDYAAGQPHFPPHNTLEVVRNTHSLGDAEAQLRAAYGPFWDAANEASGNEWTNLREREKWLRGKLNSKTPVGNWDDLNNELQQNQQDQMDFFDKYKTTVSPQEWQTARNGWQDAMVLGNLDDLLQRNFKGISRELEQRGIAERATNPSQNLRQRVFKPSEDFNQQLEDFYNGGFRDSGTNGEVLKRTIGQQHMDSLHDLGIMFNSTERMQQTQGLIKTTLSSILHHYHGVRGMLAAGAGATMLASTLGAREAGIAGVPLLTGTSAGIRNYITNRLITDPDFLKTFSYALDKVPARTAGPLLAARLIATWKNQPLKQTQKKQPEGGK